MRWFNMHLHYNMSLYVLIRAGLFFVNHEIVIINHYFIGRFLLHARQFGLKG